MAQMDVDRLQALLWGFASHRVITVAGRCGILGHLAQQADSVGATAQALGLDPLATGKVLRALCALGLLEPVETGDAPAAQEVRYTAATGLRDCLEPGPDSIVPFFEHSHVLYDRWGENLEPWLRGEPWQTKPRGAAGVEAFGAAMRALGTQVARQLVQRLDLEGVDRALDVGGGFGHYARVLCGARPRLHATVLDRPEVAELGRQQLAGSELAGRIEHRGGDYLDAGAYGGPYDLVLLANVLHQEAGERAAQLMACCCAAVAPGGRLVVLDFAIDDGQREHVLGTLFAINMRSFGDTHSFPTIASWMQAGGLTEVERSDMGPHRMVITGRRPQQ